MRRRVAFVAFIPCRAPSTLATTMESFLCFYRLAERQNRGVIAKSAGYSDIDCMASASYYQLYSAGY